MPVPIVHDDDPNEGCELVIVGVTNIAGNGVPVSVGGIHDASAESIIAIEEADFTSAVLETVLPVGLEVEGGGLSPATAEVRLGGIRQGDGKMISTARFLLLGHYCSAVLFYVVFRSW